MRATRTRGVKNTGGKGEYRSEIRNLVREKEKKRCLGGNPYYRASSKTKVNIPDRINATGRKPHGKEVSRLTLYLRCGAKEVGACGRLSRG